MDQVTTESITTTGSIDEAEPNTSLPQSNASPYTKEQDQWPYKQYLIDTVYETDEGIRVLPTSQAAGSAIKVRVGLPLTIKIVTFTMERHGKKPKIPHWNTGNANEVLEKRRIQVCNPLQLPDRKAWRVEGTYTYKLLVPLTEDDILCCGTTPAEIDLANQHTYAKADLDKTLIDSSFAVPRQTAPVPRVGG